MKALGVSPHKDLKCQDCHTAINAFPHTPDMLKQKAAVRQLPHRSADAYNRSSHAHKDL